MRMTELILLIVIFVAIRSVFGKSKDQGGDGCAAILVQLIGSMLILWILNRVVFIW